MSASTGPAAARARKAVLARAVAVLTEAARLTRPVLVQRKGSDVKSAAGRAVWVDSGRTEPGDWAEFVAQALAGAAANVGGIDLALAGRPGSWEADAVRNLLTSTVGHDEAYLLEHRTEPVVVQVYVDEILVDLGVWTTYDEANQDLDRRYDAIRILTATTADEAAQLEPATGDQEQRADAIADLEERLGRQREQDWAEYGQALTTAIKAAATRREGLAVPVVVRVDLHTFRRDARDPAWGLAEQLLNEAIETTPVPGAGRPPLERLTGAGPAPGTGATP